MRLEKADKDDISKIYHLYKISFPRKERKPFQRILRLCKNRKMELLVLKDEESFNGFVVTAVMEKLVLVDYLAIVPQKRNGGMGSICLNLLLDYYQGKKIFLEIEQINNQAKNAQQREKRKQFYLRNGMKETGVFWNMYGVPMEILAFQDIVKEETIAMYVFLYGRFWFLPIRPL